MSSHTTRKFSPTAATPALVCHKGALMIGMFSAVRNDYGPAGVKVELGHVGMLPVWGENNRNAIAAGKAKTPSIIEISGKPSIRLRRPKVYRSVAVP